MTMPVAVGVALTPDNPLAALFVPALEPPPAVGPYLPSSDLTEGWSADGVPLVNNAGPVGNWSVSSGEVSVLLDAEVPHEYAICQLTQPIPAGSPVGFSCVISEHEGGTLVIGLSNGSDPVLERAVSDGTAVGWHSADVTYNIPGTEYEYTHAYLRFDGVSGESISFYSAELQVVTPQ